MISTSALTLLAKVAVQSFLKCNYFAFCQVEIHIDLNWFILRHKRFIYSCHYGKIGFNLSQFYVQPKLPLCQATSVPVEAQDCRRLSSKVPTVSKACSAFSGAHSVAATSAWGWSRPSWAVLIDAVAEVLAGFQEKSLNPIDVHTRALLSPHAPLAFVFLGFTMSTVQSATEVWPCWIPTFYCVDTNCSWDRPLLLDGDSSAITILWTEPGAGKVLTRNLASCHAWSVFSSSKPKMQPSPYQPNTNSTGSIRTKSMTEF